MAVAVTEQGDQLAALTSKASPGAISSIVRAWGPGALALPVI